MARFSCTFALGIFAALILAGVVGAPPAVAQTVLRIANLGEPESLDPHKTVSTKEGHILRNLFEGLTVRDPKGNVVPGAAESWSVSEDGVTYRFKLRANAKWSNGDPVTANDFVFSLRRLEDPKSNVKYAEELYPIKNAEEVNSGKLDVTALGVAALDEHTVEITLKGPTPYFLQVLTVEQAMPVHEKTVRLGEDWVKPGKMVSNGAYRLDEVKPSSHIRIVKNPDYWNAGKVAIDAVMFDPSDNLATVLNRYRAGEFDIIFGDLPNDQLGFLKQTMPNELHVAPFAFVVQLGFNTTKSPFNDQRVRQALAMAIDREVLVEKITLGGELPAYGVVPDGIANYTSQKVSWATMSQADREVAAIKLMSEAGYGPGKPLSVKLEYGTSENRRRIAVAIAAMWKKLGVNLDLVNTEQRVHLANLRQGDFEVAFAGLIADYDDAQFFLYNWQTSNKENWARFSNQDYDRLMDAASVTNDQGKRAQLLAQAEQILLREMPLLPLHFGVSKLPRQPVRAPRRRDRIVGRPNPPVTFRDRRGNITPGATAILARHWRSLPQHVPKPNRTNELMPPRLVLSLNHDDHDPRIRAAGAVARRRVLARHPCPRCGDRSVLAGPRRRLPDRLAVVLRDRLFARVPGDHHSQSANLFRPLPGDRYHSVG
jgi:ABC-type oligopeptide transport system substrate-binding subunit